MQLNAGQLVVAEDHGGVGRLGGQGQLGRLAGADVGGAFGLGALLHHLADHLGPGAFRQGPELLEGGIVPDGQEHRPLGALLGVARLRGGAVVLGDPAHPLFPWKTPGGIDVRLLRQGLFAVPPGDESGADPRGLSFRGDADGADGVQPQLAQGVQVDRGELRRPARMGMQHPDAGQAVFAPAQADGGKGHLIVFTDHDVHYFPIPGDIHRDFPVDGGGILRQ